MTVKLLIHNPLPFNLTADSLQYKLFIGDVEVPDHLWTYLLIGKGYH